MVFVPISILYKTMYSQNDETSVLEVVKINFFLAANHGGQTFKDFFPKFFLGFYNLVLPSL